MTTPADPAPQFSGPILGEPAAQQAPRSHAPLWITLLIVAVVALIGFAAYLWFINAQWQDQNDELRAQSAELSAQVEALSVDLTNLQIDLDAAQANLDGATGKVSDLADTSANARDQAAFLTELTDSFVQCTQAQANHISHLQDASRYTASSLAAEGRDVQEFCAGVEQTYEEFVDSLDEG